MAVKMFVELFIIPKFARIREKIRGNILKKFEFVIVMTKKYIYIYFFYLPSHCSLKCILNYSLSLNLQELEKYLRQ